ncbi:MAG TPA: Rrf2 family transcriptional regulator [Phycisphaeraceae bacterium]|nr:Rrf2 family transcriptional regulator [Phycisphaeraceae bacterium]
MYGRQTEAAIASVSRLAEVYDDKVLFTASAIARNRNLSQPSVAKVMSVLAQAGLVEGTPGPGGGFRLAVHPSQITLRDVYVLFEREEPEKIDCPFGGGRCGGDNPCPLHNSLVEVKDVMERVLNTTTFDEFRVKYNQKKAQDPDSSSL